MTETTTTPHDLRATAVAELETAMAAVTRARDALAAMGADAALDRAREGYQGLSNALVQLSN